MLTFVVFLIKIPTGVYIYLLYAHLKMKNIITSFLFLLLAFSCSKNDFLDTKLLFETDKETYLINDKFELKIFVYPTKADKTIRFNKNLNNLNITFLSTEEQPEFHQELKKHFIEGPSLFGNDSLYIDEYIISKENPFEKTFYGTISESKNKIIFEIPELKTSNTIDKSILIKNPTITIKGNCRAVYGGEEQPFIPKEIKILIE